MAVGCRMKEVSKTTSAAWEPGKTATNSNSCDRTHSGELGILGNSVGNSGCSKLGLLSLINTTP